MISLWLPIVAAAIGVFIASSITHMVLPYHRTDLRKLPADKEDAVRDALQRVAVAPGDYAVPHAGGSAGMRDPAFIAKATAPHSRNQRCHAVAKATLSRRDHYGSLIGFLACGMALPQHSIWYRRSWATTLKSLFDSLIYGAVTAARSRGCGHDEPRKSGNLRIYELSNRLMD